MQEVLKTSLHLLPGLTSDKAGIICGFSDLFLLSLGLTVSIPGLERALHQYTLEPSEKPFDLKSVPLATAPIVEQRAGEEQSPECWSRWLKIPQQLQPSDNRLHWVCWEVLSSILFEFCVITSSVKTKANNLVAPMLEFQFSPTANSSSSW